MSSGTSSPSTGSIFVLKTRAITGQLVPARGEHVEYTELHRALRDGQVLKEVYGADEGDIYVVDYRTDAVVAFI